MELGYYVISEFKNFTKYPAGYKILQNNLTKNNPLPL